MSKDEKKNPETKSSFRCWNIPCSVRKHHYCAGKHPVPTCSAPAKTALFCLCFGALLQQLLCWKPAVVLSFPLFRLCFMPCFAMFWAKIYFVFAQLYFVFSALFCSVLAAIPLFISLCPTTSNTSSRYFLQLRISPAA